MRRAVVLFVTAILVIAVVPTANAQLTAAEEGPIVYGHHHLNVTDVDEHKRFWVDILGGELITIGNEDLSFEIIKFPNVLIFMRESAPTGGTEGSTVNHVGFWVPNVRSMVEKVEAAGYPIVTELTYIENQDTYISHVMGPDDTKVEFVENATQTVPIALHHIHFSTPQVDEMKAWYVKIFGAEPGMRGSFENAELPGVHLSYSDYGDNPLEGTRGRAIDHIGFEVRDLEAFCKSLEESGITFDTQYRVVEAINVAIAYFTDPFGTYIELTEGLDQF